jgi:hypothetical protein
LRSRLWCKNERRRIALRVLTGGNQRDRAFVIRVGAVNFLVQSRRDAEQIIASEETLLTLPREEIAIMVAQNLSATGEFTSVLWLRENSQFHLSASVTN